MTAWQVFIAEDEPPARERLVEALQRVQPGARVVGWADSVHGTGQWLATHPAPDLLLLDIQLADGLSLELFRDRPLALPVIFTTAYDRFALQAFEALAVDYLLKPVADAALAAAFDKAARWRQALAPGADRIAELLGALAAPGSGQGRAVAAPRRRIVVRRGAQFQVLALDQVAYVVSVDKASVVVTRDGTRLQLDAPLAELEATLEPAQWFRANRQLLLSAGAVLGWAAAGRGRLRVQLQPALAGDVTISQERAAAFRDWLAG
ncbi:MAG: LytR/AlgR family response regulator transcription factor [Aquabacterium sp.]